MSEPGWHHQRIYLRLASILDIWSTETKAGSANTAPEVTFSDDVDVIPDVVWISRERLATALEPDGKLHFRTQSARQRGILYRFNPDQRIPLLHNIPIGSNQFHHTPRDFSLNLVENLHRLD